MGTVEIKVQYSSMVFFSFQYNSQACVGEV